MFTSQRFIDDRTGAIVTQVPISEIAHFEKYSGPVEAGEFDLQAQQAATMPDCPHSACSQNFIDTGEASCLRESMRKQIKALNNEVRKSIGVWWACPECGCTDVQDQVWANVNTDEIHDSTERYMWCEQCSDAGYDGEINSLNEVTKPCPFDAERELPKREGWT